MPAMAARPLVAVLDTNVVIAALLWNGPPSSLLTRATERQDLVLVTSPTLLAELTDILALPKFWNRLADAATSVEELVAAYRDATVLVTPREVPRVVADDVDDDHVIAAAVAARAQCIVTGDRTHLLPLGAHGDIAIISPRQCLDLLGP
ncbi:MAG: putative toxin-antitoxin system toxin component, PIN family [Planctomycetota bacterium]|jgi:putative PIN family toxin of toxin-antitoxin system|nr:putative toxin-antitoxin system toxin component, PIN family [Planctomycetota bacterium]